MKILNGGDMNRETIQKILESDIPVMDGDQRRLVKDLLHTLSPEETELAAQSSYAYWVATFSDRPPTEQERTRMAFREARRYLSYKDKAEEYLKRACNHRKERRVDLIRACFTSSVQFDSPEEAREAERIRDVILSEIEKQNAFVRGADKEGRAIAIIRSRTDVLETDEHFILTQIYNVERAIAASEYGSLGQQEMICVVFDFSTFNHSLAPSVGVVKELVSILESSYSDRLKIIIITDPPLWLRSIWLVIKPFVHPDTREKLVMANGPKKKNDIVGRIVEEDQAMPFLLPSGKLTEEVCIERFVKEVPFLCSYDRGPSERRINVCISEATATRIRGTF